MEHSNHNSKCDLSFSTTDYALIKMPNVASSPKMHAGMFQTVTRDQAGSRVEKWQDDLRDSESCSGSNCEVDVPARERPTLKPQGWAVRDREGGDGVRFAARAKAQAMRSMSGV